MYDCRLVISLYDITALQWHLMARNNCRIYCYLETVQQAARGTTPAQITTVVFSHPYVAQQRLTFQWQGTVRKCIKVSQEEMEHETEIGERSTNIVVLDFRLCFLPMGIIFSPLSRKKSDTETGCNCRSAIGVCTQDQTPASAVLVAPRSSRAIPLNIARGFR